MILQAVNSKFALKKTRRDTAALQRQKRFRVARTARGDCPGSPLLKSGRWHETVLSFSSDMFLRFLIILALHLKHMRIRSAKGNQLIVGSAFFDLSVFEKQDRIAESC